MLKGRSVNLFEYIDYRLFSFNGQICVAFSQTSSFHNVAVEHSETCLQRIHRTGSMRNIVSLLLNHLAVRIKMHCLCVVVTLKYLNILSCAQ
jgi:hypothetical protein